MKKKKIGFIFYDDIHYIHHFLGSFIELYESGKYEVDIITYEGEHTYLFSLLKLFNIPKKSVVKVPTFNYRKIINKIRNRKQPSMVFLFRKNKAFLLKYDILTFNSAKHGYLLKKRKNKTPKFVFLDHGAGDGDYIYNEKITDFDLVTIAGQKVLDLCNSSADFSKTNIKICGYQKFDTVKKENKSQKLFGNDKPVILYNPHFKRISSYYIFGAEVLNFFYKNEDFNLIFAPHINLFNKKRFLNRGEFDKKYLNEPNIIVDLGSVKSVNMSYTMTADIYVGDVSSQVYEFLIDPRPCVFINANNIDWKNNKHYRNWNLGKVITNLSDFEKILKTTNSWQQEFESKQQEVIRNTFDNDKEKSASKRVAEEIVKIL